MLIARTTLVLRRQLLQQRLRLLQIARVEAFGEPAIMRSEQFASLLRLASRGLRRRVNSEYSLKAVLSYEILDG